MAPDLPGRDMPLMVDVLVTWIGAAAAARYVMVFGGHRPGSALERRARLLVGALAMLLAIRGFSWLFSDSVALAFLTFLPITLLPLGLTIFAEGLMRRHVPQWLKLFAVGATVVAFVMNVARILARSPAATVAIGVVALVALLSTLTALGIIVLRRDRASLSRSENALVAVCGVVAAFAFPLAITDFRVDLGWPVVRLGTIGPLLLCYSLLRQPQENVTVGRWMADVLRLVGRAIFFAIVIAVVLQTTTPATIVPIFVLGIVLAFAFAIFDRLRDVERTTPQTALLRWLARERPPSWEQFGRELRYLPLTADAEVLGEAELSPYDRGAIVSAFSPTVVLSLARLRAMRDDGRASARGADQLSDLLERHGATHVGLLSAHPIRLLVVTVPELPGLRDIELALAAVVRRGQQVEIGEMRVAAD